METFNYGSFNYGNLSPIILLLKFPFPLMKEQNKFASAALYLLMLTNATV